MLTSRIDLTLPKELILELKSTIPKRKRSSFVAKALKEKLAALKQIKAFKELKGIWDKEGSIKFTSNKELSSWRKNLWETFDKKLSTK